jgi:hypothetical protein
MKSHWSVYQGKRVFISDFSNCGNNAQAVAEECGAIKATLASEMPKSILAIVDVEGTFVNPEIIQAFRQILPTTNKYVKRRAVIGLSGFRRNFVFLVSNFVGSVNFHAFDTLDEAQEWIVMEQ